MQEMEDAVVKCDSELDDTIIVKKRKITYNVVLYLLVIIFSWGSWIDINAIFSQFTIISSVLPESYELGSYLGMVIQIANIFPILYVVGRKFKPGVFHERPIITIILLLGTICLVLLAYTYDRVVIFKNGRAVGLPLLCLCFTLAIVDTLSTLTFLPFMTLFPPAYLSSYFVGQSLCSLIPGLLAFIQGIETISKPVKKLNVTTSSLFCYRAQSTSNVTEVSYGRRFSTRIYFLIIAFMMGMSLISFFILNYSNKLKSYMTKPYKSYIIERKSISKELQFSNLKQKLIHEWKTIDQPFYYYLFSITLASFIGSGVGVSIPTLLVGKYGVATTTWANNASLIAGALTSIFLLWKPFSNRYILMGYTFGYFILNVFLIVMIILVKYNIAIPLRVGQILIIVIFIICGHQCNVIRQVVCSVASTYGTERMLICSIFIQLGSFLGSLIMFLTTSVFCAFNN